MLPPQKPTNAAEFEQVLKDVQVIIDDEQQRKELLRSGGDDAQEWLDLFQLLVEYLSIATKLRSWIFRIMIGLSRRSGRHPQCLTIRGVEKLGRHPVGGGAFGDVWKGKVGQQLVCLKVIRVFEASAVQQTLKDYMQEAIIWRQLNHQNLLPFMGIYYLDEQLCLVSPWMERGNLEQYLKNTPAEDVDHDSLAHDVACGLSYLHQTDIVHGDLKGVNVLITPDLRACIGDFGLSRVSATQLLLTETSRSKGTTRWLSPELLNPGPNCYPSKESDIYAYACVCYEIYTGRAPFYEMPEATIVLAIVIHKKRPSRPENCIKLHDSIWEMMVECWSEVPSSRPTMLKILTRILEMKGSRQLEQPSEWKDPAFTHIWNDPRRRPPVVHAVQPTLPSYPHTHSPRISKSFLESEKLKQLQPVSLPGSPQPGEPQQSRSKKRKSEKDDNGDTASPSQAKRKHLSPEGQQSGWDWSPPLQGFPWALSPSPPSPQALHSSFEMAIPMQKASPNPGFGGTQRLGTPSNHALASQHILGLQQKPQSPPHLLMPDIDQGFPWPPEINVPEGDGRDGGSGPSLRIVPATPISGGGANDGPSLPFRNGPALAPGYQPPQRHHSLSPMEFNHPSSSSSSSTAHPTMGSSSSQLPRFSNPKNNGTFLFPGVPRTTWSNSGGALEPHTWDTAPTSNLLGTESAVMDDDPPAPGVSMNDVSPLTPPPQRRGGMNSQFTFGGASNGGAQVSNSLLSPDNGTALRRSKSDEYGRTPGHVRQSRSEDYRFGIPDVKVFDGQDTISGENLLFDPPSHDVSASDLFLSQARGISASELRAGRGLQGMGGRMGDGVGPKGGTPGSEYRNRMLALHRALPPQSGDFGSLVASGSIEPLNDTGGRFQAGAQMMPPPPPPSARGQKSQHRTPNAEGVDGGAGGMSGMQGGMRRLPDPSSSHLALFHSPRQPRQPQQQLPQQPRVDMDQVFTANNANFDPRSVSLDSRSSEELAAVNEFLVNLARDVYGPNVAASTEPALATRQPSQSQLPLPSLEEMFPKHFISVRDLEN